MAPGAVPLQRKRVSPGTTALGNCGIYFYEISLRQLQLHNPQICSEVAAVSRANNDSAHSRTVQNGTACNSCYVLSMPVGDFPQGAQQSLEKRPAAEVIDDQLVFRE
jgi:hypothetical protein